MTSSFKTAWAAAKSWKADNAFKHSAAVSFYTLFSLAPVTIVALAVAGFFLGQEAARAQMEAQVSQLVGPASAELIQSAAEASQSRKEGVIATIVGLVLLLMGATTVFGQLQESLNQIWKVRSKPRRHGWLIVVLRRLLSFAMVLVIGFLLLVSLVLSTVLTSVLDRLRTDLPAVPLLARAAELGAGLVVITLLFALLFKVLPDVRLRWRDVWTGALLTAVFFTVGRYLIALYLSRSTVVSIYGAAGSLVALLIWVYYSCAILFYGAEFIRASRHAQGLHPEPKATAVLVREEIVDTEGTGSEGRSARSQEARAKS